MADHYDQREALYDADPTSFGRGANRPTAAQGNQPFGGMTLKACPKCGYLWPVGVPHNCPPSARREYAPSPADRGDGCRPVEFASMGCICPPGANKECEAPLCPRKPSPRAS